MTNVIVGNNIGASNVKSTRYYAKMCILVGLIQAVLSVLLLVILDNLVVESFSSKNNVEDLIQEALPFVIIFVFTRMYFTNTNR